MHTFGFRCMTGAKPCLNATLQKDNVCAHNKHFAFYLKLKKCCFHTLCNKNILTSMPGWQPSIPLSVAPTRNNFKSGKTQRTHFHVSGTTQHDTTQHIQHCNNHAAGGTSHTEESLLGRDAVLLGNQLPEF